MRIQVVCEGISPLLLAPMTDKVIEELRNPTKREPPNPDRTLDQDAAEKLLADEKGRLGIPSFYLFACLREAGRHIKLSAGRKKISTRQETLLPSFLLIEEDFLIFNPAGNIKDPPENRIWIVDKKAGKPAANLPTMPIIRPKFPKWGFTTIVDLDETGDVNEAVLRNLFDIAGKKIGIGAFRPTCRGPFGRFKVKEWKPLDGDGKAKTTEEKTD